MKASIPLITPPGLRHNRSARVAVSATPRLVGRPAEQGDYADLRLIHGDPICKASMEVPGYPMNEGYTRAFLVRAEEGWAAHGFGFRVFDLARDHAFVGFGGLRRATIAGSEEISLGFAVRRRLWGRGLASEMVRAILEEGFSDLGFESIVAITFPENDSSRAVLEKSGFRVEREIVQNGLPHVCYRATAGSGVVR